MNKRNDRLTLASYSRYELAVMVRKIERENAAMKEALEQIAYYDESVKLLDYTGCVMHARQCLAKLNV